MQDIALQQANPFSYTPLGASLPLKPYLPISPALPKWSSKSHTWGLSKLNFSITQDLNELVYSHSGTIVGVNHCKSMVHTMLTSVYRMQMMAHSTCMVEQILWLPLAKVVTSSHEYGSIVCLISLVFRSNSRSSKTLPDPDVARGLSWVPPPFPHALLAGMPAFFPVSLFNLQGSMRKHTGKNLCPLKDWRRKMVDGIHLSVPFEKPHPQIHFRVWVETSVSQQFRTCNFLEHWNFRCLNVSVSRIQSQPTGWHEPRKFPMFHRLTFHY